MRRLKEGRRILSAALYVAFLLYGASLYASEPDNRLKLNCLDRNGLAGLQLLTPFQIESILDYRKMYGDILSSAELSLVDGFSEDDVEALSSVISFDPSPSESGRAKHVFSTRFRKQYAKEGFTLTSKYSLSVKNFECGAVIDNDPGEKFPDFYSAYASWKGVTAGDFKACFGQGLVMWKGMSLSSLGEPSVLVRRESGIQGYKSSDETSYLRGAAYSGRWGGFALNALVAADKMLAGANASWRFGTFKVGVNIFSGHTIKASGSQSKAFAAWRQPGGLWANGSIDFYGSVGGVRLFGELATNERFAPALRTGAVWRADYSFEAGAAVWAYAPAYSAPHSASSVKDQVGAECALRYTLGKWKFNANVSYRYKPTTAASTWKYRVAAQYSFDDGSSVLYHFRNGQHRLEGRLVWRDWRFAVRAEGNLRGYGFYAEASYRRRRFEATARFTYYNTDGWESRIYLYERDVPQSYSTVACYGKGTGEYLLLKYSPAGWVEFWLKAQQNYLAFFTRITIPG